MGEFSLPFPDKVLAHQELTYDPCYGKIPEQDRKSSVEVAWQRGEQAARKAFVEFGGSSNFQGIALHSGLTIEKKKIDYVVGNKRYFSDYISGRNLLIIYLPSVALWAERNALDLADAVNLIISHEYFHFLEWTSLGLTSKLYTVPMLSMGKLKFGKTGIRALSEIGAHAFAHTYFQLVDQKKGGILNEC